MQSLRVHRACLQDAGGAALPCMRAWGDEVSDYMQEAKRLTNDEISEILLPLMPLKDPYVFARAVESAVRAALLAHIERGRVPDGWKLVPVEPTTEMVAEIEDVSRIGAVWTAASVYRAMLAAAPAAPDQSATKPAEVPMPEEITRLRADLAAKTAECERLRADAEAFRTAVRLAVWAYQ